MITSNDCYKIFPSIENFFEKTENNSVEELVDNLYHALERNGNALCADAVFDKENKKSFSVWVCGKNGKTMDERNDLHTLDEVKQAAIELSAKFDLNDYTTNKIRYKSIWA